MNIRLNILGMGVPSFFKKKVLEELFRITAEAFDADVPVLDGLSAGTMLERFALFSNDEARKAVVLGCDIKSIKAELFRGACELGVRARVKLRPKKPLEILASSRILYRILGIEFRGSRDGDVVISKCVFSEHYSGEVCRIMSSLDEGVAFGLSGGAALSFRERITEGAPCCRARIEFEGLQS